MKNSDKSSVDWFYYEDQCRAKGFVNVCGIDEAGRGPLAGPVFAAAVILPQHVRIDGLNDSKKVSPKKREMLFDEIKEKALAYCVASADEKEIDDINILNATFLAMRRALDGLCVKADFALIDGNCIKGMDDIQTQTIIGGDAKSASIAAASILAKVSRDRFMCGIAEKYPCYKFEKHKGYGTKEHIELLKKYGVCEIYRKSFLKKMLGNE